MWHRDFELEIPTLSEGSVDDTYVWATRMKCLSSGTSYLRDYWRASPSPGTITLTNNKREVVRPRWIILGPSYDPSW